MVVECQLVKLIERAHILAGSQVGKVNVLSEFEHKCPILDNNSCVITVISCRIQAKLL